MPVSIESLTNQIHLHNIMSCISEIEDIIDQESFESFVQDEEVRMTVYRTLMMVGIETSNIRKSDITQQLDLAPLLSMKDADFINKLGKEYYSVYSFVNNDLPFFKSSIDLYLKSLSESNRLPSRANNRVVA